MDSLLSSTHYFKSLSARVICVRIMDNAQIHPPSVEI